MHVYDKRRYLLGYDMDRPDYMNPERRAKVRGPPSDALWGREKLKRKPELAIGNMDRLAISIRPMGSIVADDHYVPVAQNTADFE